MKTEFERRKEKKIPTLAADFNGCWRELVTTFKHERAYLRDILGKSYGLHLNHFGGYELVEYIFAKGHSGQVPFTYKGISDREYNEVEKNFNKGQIGVWWMRGNKHVEIHRATGSSLI